MGDHIASNPIGPSPRSQRGGEHPIVLHVLVARFRRADRAVVDHDDRHLAQQAKRSDDDLAAGEDAAIAVHQLHLGAPVGLEICHVTGAGAVGLVVEIPARLRAGVLPAARRGLGGVHLGADQLAQMVELGHHQPTRPAELDVGHRVAISGAEVEQHPGAMLRLDVAGDVLGHLDHAIGEAAEHLDIVVIFVVVATIGRIAADDVAPALDRLLPHLQLDVVDIVDLRVHLDHLEVEEVAVDLVAVALEDRRRILQPLQILADHRDLEEAVAGLDEALVHRPGLILVEQILLGAGLGLLPTKPRQLLRRDTMLVEPRNVLDIARFLARLGRKAKRRKPRIGARDAICVAGPPADEECPFGQAVQPGHAACAPVVHPLRRRLVDEQPIRIVLGEAFLERLQTLDVAVTCHLRQMSAGVADTFAPGDRLFLGAGDKKIEPRAIGELHHLSVRTNDVEPVAEITIGERSDVGLDQRPVDFAVFLGVGNVDTDHVRVNGKPQDIDQRRADGGDAKLAALAAIENMDAVVEAFANLDHEPALALPHDQL